MTENNYDSKQFDHNSNENAVKQIEEPEKDLEENYQKQKQSQKFNKKNGYANIDELKKLIDFRSKSAIICIFKENNPNYLAIIHANKNFYKNFGIKEHNLIGKSFDFLFDGLDLDYSNEDQIEYIRLIKSVKDFHECSITISINDHIDETPSKIKFKVSFLPSEGSEIFDKHAIFTFEKFYEEDLVANSENSTNRSENIKSKINLQGGGRVNAILLKNLERTLRKERILREFAGLVISDMSIRDIAQNLSKILCQHLKVDRCIIHDYKESQTTFIAEFFENSSPMFKDENDEVVDIESLTKYINFQNHFYNKFGNKTRKSSISIIDDISLDTNFIEISDICKNFQIDSQIAITTSFNGKINGGIYIHQSQKRSWLHEEIDLLETIADQFAIALDRSDSIERVMVANHQLVEKTQQLKESLQQEKEMRKMQNEFVALVSHEFKTPLQIIDGTREILSRKIKKYDIKDESFSKSLGKISAAIQRMNGLIHSTLNLARMENGANSIAVEYSKLKLKEFIIDVIDRNYNLAQSKNIEILVNIDQLPDELYCDRKLLDHAFTNVVTNAIKYSNNNSKVKILAKSNDKKIAIRVVDQGIGIPKEDIENIGKKFFRAKNTLAVAGTGIGIYLTKHFIELQGGGVLIESELNQGTSVTITLVNRQEKP